MKINVWNSIQQLSKEKGVPASAIVNAIKESMRAASTKYFSHDEKIDISFKPEKGELRVFSTKRVVKKPQNPALEISLDDAQKIDTSAKEGQLIEIDLPSDTLGRIAAQSAKHVMFQMVRNAEQETIYHNFMPLLGEMVTGVLRRFDSNNNLILDVMKTEACLPYREKLSDEEFIRGDRIKAVVTQVSRNDKEHQVLLSRTSPRFLKKLLEFEIPEISNGNIEILNICRQPGERAKVAVASKEKDIDPLGACIGVKGNRILAISKELHGEKIDIIVYSDNPVEYAKSALSPARPQKVFILNKEEKVLQAVVAKNQLSLAIGKKGMNVRLASRLVGWKIDIKSDSE